MAIADGMTLGLVLIQLVIFAMAFCLFYLFKRTGHNLGWQAMSLLPAVVFATSYWFAMKIGLLAAFDVILPLASLTWMGLFLIISLKPWPNVRGIK